MKFTLKDYQDEAVRDVLVNLRKASRRWHEENDKHAFSLTATTGAGKTVMAAAAFEALFHGDDTFEFDADPGAVVIWFSDDPALNEQTRFRLMEASELLNFTDLVVVQNTFNREKFEPGKVYFLNTQKLGKNSLLVRGHDPEAMYAERGEPFPELRPDMRSYTIWDTIQNTIDDPSLTLYLVLDEAHRGMGNATRAVLDAKSTIVKRLINGAGAVPAIPIVWGISATVERFNAAMAGAEGRSTLPHVVVDSAKVQDSGLLKDTIILDIPEKAGHFDTVLVRRATDKIKEISAAWAEYAKQQDDADVVKPLMVLQVPNTPDPNEIGRALDMIFQHWPELTSDSVAHVFGEHSTQTFGVHAIPYISPERVQESTWVRVLIAKDAISTGWDCPRAEVMVSFRPARDRTHITQLLGRMVRTPLARRIPGNERLNSVECLLPFFDVKSVEAVADALMNGGGDVGDAPLPGRRVLINPKEMTPNPSIPESIWEKFLSLPSQALPQRVARPVKRLTALAHELAADGLLPDAGKTAHGEMHKVLDAARTRYAGEIATARKGVLTVDGKTLTADLKEKEKSFDDFWEEADYSVIEDAYRRASRALSPDLSRTYAEYLATKAAHADTPEDALMEAHADIAALGLVSEVKTYLDGEADKLSKEWLEKYRVAIKGLSDERRDAYRQIKEMSTEPQDIDLARPNSWMAATSVRETNGSETALPTYEHHMLCDETGGFPAEMNTPEIKVLETEMRHPGFQAWYRNPSRPSQDSLGVAYFNNTQTKIVRPDFIFFSLQPNGTIAADIVDPHGTHLSDAMPKLRGLARYAETHPNVYRRIEAVEKVGDKYRVLDLTNAEVRKAVADAKEARTLFDSGVSSEYLTPD
ncbi:type III restriction endonuclease subunit R [Mesorhizobium sp. B1-1-1]|uniref:DEAD/DEAH box helicase n=1 Tax=Mesorhizobium sp. B1-1-1 TaxID=2589983 RepID=UPI0011289F73|nr:DEAD/DEAH box helicase family protein [Mesorhizobium sp. B1-1-1]TPN63526.1 type III restriction endonuclease subunit R [Mesorhizobium sp. B1-1-1]